MFNVYTVGEALIDFIPLDDTTYEKAPGGAPANVAAMVSILGGNGSFIGKLGQDAFGDFLLETLINAGVDTQYVHRTKDANTALAFVALGKDGSRDFFFYRNPSADMLLTADEVSTIPFTGSSILHFCSVSLIECPTKGAHLTLIDNVRNSGGIISFDPNVRLPLWPSPDLCRTTIHEFIGLSDLIKISDEELEFITGHTDIDQGIAALFVGQVKIVIYTKGKNGASIYFKETAKPPVHVPGVQVKAIDTTGAGDAFIGAFLYELSKLDGLTPELDLSSELFEEILVKSNGIAAATTTKKGAISSYK